MSALFFSIVIPVYNRADMILPTLESVLKQTFTDFECIIVDDGSEDAKELEQLIKNLNDNRFVYIYQKNGGGGAARNTGIKTARGSYIAFLDSDDIYLPTKLEKAYNYLTSHLECTCFYTRARMDRGEGIYWEKPPRALGEKEHMGDYLLRRRGWTPTSTMVIQSSLAKAVMFNSKLPYSQDTDFAIRLYNTGGIFYMDPEVSAICLDIVDYKKISTQDYPYETLKKWISMLRPYIPSKAYYGYMGWHISKKIIRQNFWLATRLFLHATLRGSYSPKMLVVVFCQVFLPAEFYRITSNQISRFLKKKLNKSK